MLDLLEKSTWQPSDSVSKFGFDRAKWTARLQALDAQRMKFRNLWLPGVALLIVAGLGVFASLMIKPLPQGTKVPFPTNPFSGTVGQLRQLFANQAIRRTAIGVAFFWSLASLANLNIPEYADTLNPASEMWKGALMAVLVIGVGLGSVLAGVWSRGKVELGIVPIGTAGLVIALLGLFFTGTGPLFYTSAVDTTTAAIYASSGSSAFVVTMFWLLLLGISSGLFDVPLEAFLQERSPPEARGSILAATNMLVFSSMIVCAGGFHIVRTYFGMSPRLIFLVAGLVVLPVVWYTFILIPGATMRFTLWLTSQLIYRVRIYGQSYVPETGGALLVSNHVTWIDGFLLMITSPRPVRMIAHSDNITKGFVSWMAEVMNVIPIDASKGPKSIVRSLQTARQAVLDGEVVCIFAEGALTRTGQLQPFQRGMMKIIEGTNSPLVPLYLDGLWGSIFSYRGGKFFWKWPRCFPYEVSIVYGKPILNPKDVHDVRQQVLDLGATAVEHRKSREMNLPRLMLRKCRRAMFRTKVSDSIGQELTGGKLLTGSLLMRKTLRKLLGADEKFVGLLLPPSVGGVVVNAALTLDHRVPVNLNYTVTAEVMQNCIDQCGIKKVITSRKFLEKLKVELKTEYIYLEDVKERISTWDKLVSAAQAYGLPAFIIERILGLTRIGPADLATIIFTSGSTGEPKGVMLSMSNISSNIDAIDHLFHLKPEDTMLGVLPFFHSFGFTVTLWAVLTLDTAGVYHFNPLDARQIGQLCQKHNVTIIMSTPTFLRNYLKRCEPEQFPKLELVITGAEKLPPDLATAFQEKFKVRPTEGYGTTELSPLVSVNVPDHRANGWMQRGTKEGSVGRPIPNTAAKVVDPETGADLGVNEAGLLMIKGPNVMQGYLNKPELTAKVLRDGWYSTGDIARIDDEGFITITDRQSRFSKIGGEMVPHLLVEQMLNKILATDADDQELKVVVTAIPDERKGERLIVVHKPLAKPMEQVVEEMHKSGLPNLWLPSRDSFLQVDEIPVLGTGKLDLKGLKSLALGKFAAVPA